MIIDKIVSPLKEFGIATGLMYLLHRVLNRMSPHAGIVFYEIVEQPVAATSLLKGHHLRGFSLKAIDAVDPLLRAVPRSPEILHWRFAQDAICLGLFRHSELVGFAWFAFNTYAEDEVRCDFVLGNGDTQVFDFDVYINPRYRFGFGFLALWEQSNRFLRTRGIRSSVSRISKFNLASRKAHARLGAVTIGTALFLKLGVVELMLASFKPYLYASISRCSRVGLYLARPRPTRL